MYAKRAQENIGRLISSLSEFLLGKELLGIRQCAIVWSVVFLLCSPFIAVFFSSDFLKHTVDWFSDFNLRWTPHGDWTPASAIIGNVMRATIMFIPVFFLVIALYGGSRRDTVAEKLAYKIPACFVSAMFFVLYFPNRAIGYINTFGSTPKREIALAWSFSIWGLFLLLFIMLAFGNARMPFLWGLYFAIILAAFAGWIAA